MRTTEPRIAPLADDEITDVQEVALAPFRRRSGRLLNIVRTIAHAPDALTAFGKCVDYVFSPDSSLTVREREIVILRVGYLCRSGYEVAQHTRIALAAGLTASDIENIKLGESADWSPADRVLIQACDELVSDHFVSPATWKRLETLYDDGKLIDIVFVATEYIQVSSMLNSFGVQPEDDLVIDIDLQSSR